MAVAVAVCVAMVVEQEQTDDVGQQTERADDDNQLRMSDLFRTVPKKTLVSSAVEKNGSKI